MSAARRGQIRGSWKDLNSRGRGTITYRMAVSGDSLVWIDRHPDCVGDGSRLPKGNFLAAERNAATWVEVPEGLIVVDIRKDAGSGSGASYSAGVVTWDEEKERLVVSYERTEHIGVKKTSSGFVHILELNGERKEFGS